MEKVNTFILKGNIIYSKSSDTITCLPNAYLVCEVGKVAGVYKTLPEQYCDREIIDYGDKLIIPGLVDLHTHAPQYAFRGLGMDLELIEWLNTNTFIEEAKYSDIAYANKAYTLFANDLKKSATTRACIFGTIHLDSTKLLMELLDKTGVKSMVGKVNMNRNSPEYLCEMSVEQAIADTEKWIKDTYNKFENVTPILTPRFIPSCSNALMQQLSLLQKKFDLPVQSHLSENISEIKWVAELLPESNSYGDAYNQFDLFGKATKTVMAHCVHSTEEEIELIKENDVYIAHCPESNMNLSSGIAPIRTYLDKNIHVGLGTDVAGGSSISIFKAMACAIQVSKLRWCLVNQALKPLTVDEAFYLGTKAGGAFFGKVGSFEQGYEFDAIVIDDSSLLSSNPLTLKQRLERVIYFSEDQHICDKYVAGKRVSYVD